MEKWRGKIAVVTGASCGIGESLVKDFAKNGVNVVGLARRSGKIDEYAEKLGETPGKIYSRKCDVSDLESIKEAFNWIETKFGTINILVNNAAILYNGTVLGEGDDVTSQLNAVINTNFTGAVHTTREGIRLIKKSDDYGLVININSVAGNYVPFSYGINVYAPTKHALRAFTEVVRQELVTAKNEKIRVTNLSPGAVKTEMAVAAGMVPVGFDIELMYKHISHLTADNVSQTVMFLLEVPYNVNITQLTIQPVGEKV